MSDDKLVKRGELVLLIGEEEDPEEELKRMNRGKVGRPFTYTNSLIWALAVLRVCLRLPYRQLTGFARRLARILGFRLTIDPSTVYRRIRRLAEGGRTVILTTNDLEDAERTCDRVAIIDKGRLLALGTVEELEEKFQERGLEEVKQMIRGRAST